MLRNRVFETEIFSCRLNDCKLFLLHTVCLFGSSRCIVILLLLLIIIIQEISIAHNPELKAGAQCAHRKTQNELPIKTKTKRQTKHTITTTHWTIVQSYNQQQPKRWTALKLLTVQIPSRYAPSTLYAYYPLCQQPAMPPTRCSTSPLCSLPVMPAVAMEPDRYAAYPLCHLSTFTKLYCGNLNL